MQITVHTRILNKNISINTPDEFEARYKGHYIWVTSKHKHGKPRYDHLKRFDINVSDKRGCLVVCTYDDHRNIKDAIRQALIGARLIPDWRRK